MPAQIIIIIIKCLDPGSQMLFKLQKANSYRWAFITLFYHAMWLSISTSVLSHFNKDSPANTWKQFVGQVCENGFIKVIYIKIKNLKKIIFSATMHNTKEQYRVISENKVS